MRSEGFVDSEPWCFSVWPSFGLRFSLCEMGMIMPTQQDELKLYVQTASPDSRLKKKKKICCGSWLSLCKRENPAQSGLIKKWGKKKTFTYSRQPWWISRQPSPPGQSDRGNNGGSCNSWLREKKGWEKSLPSPNGLPSARVRPEGWNRNGEGVVVQLWESTRNGSA